MRQKLKLLKQAWRVWSASSSILERKLWIEPYTAQSRPYRSWENRTNWRKVCWPAVDASRRQCLMLIWGSYATFLTTIVLSCINANPTQRCHSNSHLFRSCARTVPSSDALRMALPLCVQQTPVTAEVCSSNVTVQNAVRPFQIFT